MTEARAYAAQLVDLSLSGYLRPRVIPVLPALGLVLAWAAVEGDRIPHTAWMTAILALVFLFREIGTGSSYVAAKLPSWLLVVFCFYVALQLAPLPEPLLRWLQPNHSAEAANTLSLAPRGTRSHLLRIISYVLIFLLVRERVASLGRRAWQATVPLLFVAGMEALLGLEQLAMGGPLTQSTGTYQDHSHFASLLAMVLPLAVGFAVVKYRFSQNRAITLAVLVGITLVLLSAIVGAGSRMAFVASFLSMLLFISAAMHSRLARTSLLRSGITFVALFGVFALALVHSAQIIPRFLKLLSPETLRFELPFGIWSQTLDVIRNYPVFGCGLGVLHEGVQAVHPDGSAYFAQNDYLQLLAELGVAGSALAIVIVLLVLWRSVRAVYGAQQGRLRWLALATLCSMATLLLHSIIEFNLYVPANAMLFAWIAGISAGIRLQERVSVEQPSRHANLPSPRLAPVINGKIQH